jgi:hypothetical protein
VLDEVALPLIVDDLEVPVEVPVDPVVAGVVETTLVDDVDELTEVMLDELEELEAREESLYISNLLPAPQYS